MLHNHHSKSKGLKQPVRLFTTKHAIARDRHNLNDAFMRKRKRKANNYRLPLLYIKRSVSLLSYE